MKQLALFETKSACSFGGSLLRGRRRTARPLSTKKSIHVVLRAGHLPQSLLKHKPLFTEVWCRFGKSNGVTTYRLAICGNHVHAVIRIPSRRAYVRFVRAVTGSIARRLKLSWSVRPFTRVLEWGRDFARAAAYVVQNTLEAEGLVPYRPRRSRRSK